VTRLPLLALTLAVALAGCGQTEIDRDKAETFVRSYFSPDAQSAECPDGVEAEKGKTFRCTAVDTDGRRFGVTVRVLDEDGRVQVRSEDVRPE